MNNDWVQLDTDKIKEIIQRDGLKRWWVAEFAGVHKTTLRRWLSGKIKRVRDSHAEGLARVLETPKCVIAFTAE